MSKSLSIVFLGLYFFCYTTPQYIKDVYYVYDRVSVQFLFLSILNVIAFYFIYRHENLKNLLSIFNKSRHLLAYVLFIVIASLSLLVAVNRIEGIVVLTKTFILFVAFINILLLSHNKKINFIKVFIYFTLLSIIIETFRINLSIYDSVVSKGNFLIRSMEYRGFTGNINISSFSLAIKIPVLIYLIYTVKNIYKRLLLLILIISSVLTILLLSTRSALIAIMLIIVSSIALVVIRRSRTLLIRTAHILIAISLSFFSYSYINEKNTSNMVVERFSSITNPIEDNSVNERLQFYKIAVEDIVKKPILGVGIGNWKLTSIQRGNSFLDGYRVPYNVHNDFLEVAAEIGLLGGIAYIYFIFYPFIIALSKTIYNREIKLSFLLFLIIGVYILDSSINFPMLRPVNFIYLLFAIVLFHNARNKNLL